MIIPKTQTQVITQVCAKPPSTGGSSVTFDNALLKHIFHENEEINRSSPKLLLNQSRDFDFDGKDGTFMDTVKDEVLSLGCAGINYTLLKPLLCFHYHTLSKTNTWNLKMLLWKRRNIYKPPIQFLSSMLVKTGRVFISCSLLEVTFFGGKCPAIWALPTSRLLASSSCEFGTPAYPDRLLCTRKSLSHNYPTEV